MLCIHVWNSTDNASDVSGNDAQLRSESGHDILTAKLHHFLSNNKHHHVITEETALMLTRGHPQHNTRSIVLTIDTVGVRIIRHSKESAWGCNYETSTGRVMQMMFNHVTSEILTALTMKCTCWDVKSWNLVEFYRHAFIFTAENGGGMFSKMSVSV
jgi:hypothetical protein